MRALDRKLLRDLHRLRAQAIAIGLVVASGITLFVGTATTSRALRLSELRYYDEQRFAQVWSRLARAPERVVDELAAIPGVSKVDGRLVAQGILDLPGIDEPASGLFIAIPPTPGHSVNDVYIRQGRHIEPTGDEVLVNEPFAERSGLNPGDAVNAVVAGRRVRLHVVGVALSPEFLMQIAPGGLIPDDRRFGVFWLSRDRLSELLDLRHAVNDVALRLAPDANESRVIAAVDRVLEPYGGQGAYGRSTQPSHVMLEAHIVPVAALAVVVPSIFLAVAVFLVNMVLSRLVATDRIQIGMLKAFGYSNGRLARHYLWLVAVIVAGGILAGLPFGIWLGHGMSRWFATFFRFPALVFRVEPGIVAAGAAAMLGSSMLGTVATLRSIVRLPPIVAMTPPVPIYRPTLLDRLTTMLHAFSSPLRMIVRSVTRHPLRAILTTAGMSLAVAIVIFGGFTADAMARVVDVRFQREERQDLAVVLTELRSLGASADVAALPGVRVAEPFRAVAARLRIAGDVQDVTLIGLEPSARLRHIVDMQYRTLTVPRDGLIVSAWLARRSRARLGAPVALEIREGRRRLVTSRVVAFVDEPLGTNIYMDLRPSAGCSGSRTRLPQPTCSSILSGNTNSSRRSNGRRRCWGSSSAGTPSRTSGRWAISRWRSSAKSRFSSRSSSRSASSITSPASRWPRGPTNWRPCVSSGSGARRSPRSCSVRLRCSPRRRCRSGACSAMRFRRGCRPRCPAGCFDSRSCWSRPRTHLPSRCFCWPLPVRRSSCARVWIGWI